MSDNIHLSIIVPSYNAEGFVARSLDTLDSFIRGLACRTELVVVDDGSPDRSRAVISEWTKVQRPYPIATIFLDKNHGKGGAVAAGMLAAKGKFRIFLDVDLAYEPSQILRILEALEENADVAVACRVHEDSRYTISPAFFHYLYTRHLASRFINFFLRHTIIPHSHDSQAGLKGFGARAAEAIFSRQIIRGFPFDIEALYLAEKMGLSIREVPVEYRYFSEPTTVVFLKDGIEIAGAMAKIHAHRLGGGYKLPKKTGLRKLVVNADDYGMTLPVSRGIIAAASTGMVRSTSVITNSDDFDASMDELLKSHSPLDVGLHATLTWGRPVSDPNDVPSLVRDDGTFLSKGELLKKAIFGKISEEHVYRELRAQCEKLARRWPAPNHLDGHHHVHTFPIVRDAAERVAREFGIKSIRAPREGLWSPWRRSILKRLLIALLSASRPAYWRSRGFKSPDNFGGFSLGAGKNLKERWTRTLERLPPGTTELMAHPGYASENFDSYNKEREDEIAVLADPEIVKAAIEAGIEVISFREMTT